MSSLSLPGGTANSSFVTSPELGIFSIICHLLSFSKLSLWVTLVVSHQVPQHCELEDETKASYCPWEALGTAATRQAQLLQAAVIPVGFPISAT